MFIFQLLLRLIRAIIVLRIQYESLHVLGVVVVGGGQGLQDAGQEIDRWLIAYSSVVQKDMAHRPVEHRCSDCMELTRRPSDIDQISRAKLFNPAISRGGCGQGIPLLLTNDRIVFIVSRGKSVKFGPAGVVDTDAKTSPAPGGGMARDSGGRFYSG